MFLSSLATLNFSLALIVGLLASPLSFMRPWPQSPAARWACTVLLNGVAPTAVLALAGTISGQGISELLREAAFGWDVAGVYTPIVVWCVWWPAWLCGSVIVLGQPEVKAKTA